MAASPRFAEALAGILNDRESLPWPDRQALARSLGQVLAGGDRTDVVLRLVHALAEDPKWEVRKETAELLVLLPDGDFLKLAARLSADDNAFVRNTAVKALERRQQGGRESVRRRDSGLYNVELDLASMERLHGPKIADAVRKASERMYDLLIREVVHEMRGIVTPLKGHTIAILAGLKEKKPDLKAARGKMVRVRDRLIFLEQLLNDMRAFSQSLSRERRAEQLSDVASDAYAMALERLQSVEKDAAKVKVKLDIPDGLVVEMARHQIAVALANVIKNAIEAAMGGKHGRVELRATQSGGLVTIRIENNGPGRTPEDLEALREFVPGRTTMKNKGTGFGLPIAHRNVVAHGGRMELDSPQGRGFTVTITLPSVQRNSAEA